MKKRMFVIKNIKTKKYYTGTKLDGPCTSNHIEYAEIFDESWIKHSQKPNENFFKKNEKFIEIEIKEKK